MELSSTHKIAAVVHEGGGKARFEIESVPIPEPGPQDVLVQLSVTGVCGTDIALASGELGPTRRILGHEGVGRVVKLGSGLSESQVKIGQRVGVAWQRDICGACAMCLTEGGETRCLEQLNSGRKIDGTFAEYTVVPYRYLTKLNEGPEDQVLAPILCGGVTIYKSLKIIAIDAGKEKEKYCLDLGAEVFIDLAETADIASVVRKKTSGRGAAAVLVTAGSGKAYQDALGMLGPFGSLVCIGIPPPSQLVNFHPLLFIDMGIRIIGSAVGTRLDIQEAIAFVERGLVKPTVQITANFKLFGRGVKLMKSPGNRKICSPVQKGCRALVTSSRMNGSRLEVYRW